MAKDIYRLWNGKNRDYHPSVAQRDIISRLKVRNLNDPCKLAMMMEQNRKLSGDEQTQYNTQHKENNSSENLDRHSHFTKTSRLI